MDTPGDDERILARLDDICVRVKDTLCLRENEWLHDKIIHYFLERLRQEVFREWKEEIEVIAPAVAVIINTTSDVQVVRNMIEPLRLREKKIVLVPVNNASTRLPGTHWSLLVVLPAVQTFLHLDGLVGMNRASAKLLSEKLGKHEEWTDPLFAEYSGSRQKNRTDCGLFVLADAKVATASFIHGVDQVIKLHLPRGEEVSALRLQLLEILLENRDMQVMRIG